jgi:hypothetical protein
LADLGTNLGNKILTPTIIFLGMGGGLVEISQKTKYQKWIFYIYCQLLLAFDQLTQLTQLLFMRSKMVIKIWIIV